MNVLLDTNVIIDLLQKREPWWKDAAIIFRAAALKQVSACITTKQLADIHFFTRRQLKGQADAESKTRRITGALLSLLILLDVTASDCQSAFAIDNGDYEDAMLIASATRASMDYIITRNPLHFKTSPVLIVSPSDFVNLLPSATGPF